jgi:hypothetical protein
MSQVKKGRRTRQRARRGTIQSGTMPPDVCNLSLIKELLHPQKPEVPALPLRW